MAIYSIKFTSIAGINKDGELGKPIENLAEGESNSEIESKFELIADDLADAIEIGFGYLNNSFGDNFKVIGINELKDIMIVNLPDKLECDCAYCRTERAAEEDKIRFLCSCQEEIVIVDDFDEIDCPYCSRHILRDHVIGSNGNYTLIDIDFGE